MLHVSKASIGHEDKDSSNPSAEGAHKVVVREEHLEQLIIIIPILNIKIEMKPSSTVI